MFGGWIPLFDAKNRINSLNQIKGVPVRTLFWTRSLVALLCSLPFCGQRPVSRKASFQKIPEDCLLNNPVLLCDSATQDNDCSFLDPPHPPHNPIFAIATHRKALEKSFPFSFSGHHHYDDASFDAFHGWLIPAKIRPTDWEQRDEDKHCMSR